MQYLKKIWPAPLHCFLVPLFFIIRNYVDFLGLTDFSKLSWSIAVWLTAPLLLILVYRLLLKDLQKASLITTVLLCIYFFTGPLIKEFKDLPYLHFLFKYSVLIPLLFILITYIHIQLFKNKKNFYTTHLFLSITFLSLLAFDIIRLAGIGPEKLKLRNSLQITNDVKLKQMNISTELKPDIYLLIFDEHPSSKSLKTLFNYDNTALDSSLTNLGFKVSSNATSQFPYTVPSLYSLLGLNEFHSNNTADFTFKELNAVGDNLTDNKLIPFLQTNGYNFINASIFDVKKKPSLVRNYLDWNTPEDMIRKQTFFNRIKEDLSWNYTNLYKRKFIGDLNSTIKKEVAYTKEIVHLIDSSLLLQANKPKFFYGHFFLPHLPYKFNREGNVIHWTYETYLNDYSSNETYLSQLEYTRKFIINLTAKIREGNQRPAIIIVQGDHGYRMFDLNKYSVDNKYKILSAIYFPDQDYSQISDSLFSPNTFRIILNKYFNQQIPLLKK